MSIRVKLLLLSLTMLVLPWAGCQYLGEMETLLRKGQEETLMAKTQALGTLLNDRHHDLYRSPALLRKSSNDLFAYQKTWALIPDGYADDWSELRDTAKTYTKKHAISRQRTPHKPISFKQAMAADATDLYLLFEVKDSQVVLAAPEQPIHAADHVQIAFTNPEREYYRLIIGSTAPGRITLDIVNERNELLSPYWADEIKGQLQLNSIGYTLELRIPRLLLGEKLGFSVTNVDSASSREHVITVGSGPLFSKHNLGTLVLPSAKAEQLLHRLDNSGRSWVLDTHGRVLAWHGNVLYKRNADSKYKGSRSSAYTMPGTGDEDTVATGWHHQLFHFIYHWWLRPTVDREPGLDTRSKQLDRGYIAQALKGSPQSHWRRSELDENRMILSASHPIYHKETIIGAVVMEQSVPAIQSTTNKTMIKLVDATLFATLIVVCGLLSFATLLSVRIRRLRNAADNALTIEGTVESFPLSTKGDEIGDLSRSFSHLLEALQDYTGYLRTLASKLSHELRTPLAVVKSSLENIRTQEISEQGQTYLERAQSGADRLGSILNAMSSATRLEQSIQSAEPEPFDLKKVLDGCFSAYGDLHADVRFICQTGEQAMPMHGVPEMIAQLLDKLVDNAVDFTPNKGWIRLTASGDANYYTFSVANEGPSLPEKMQGRLFDSMVSMRDESNDATHLGLGLYIVRLIAEFHGGTVVASNLPNDAGVEFKINVLHTKPTTSWWKRLFGRYKNEQR